MDELRKEFYILNDKLDECDHEYLSSRVIHEESIDPYGVKIYSTRIEIKCEYCGTRSQVKEECPLEFLDDKLGLHERMGCLKDIRKKSK